MEKTFVKTKNGFIYELGETFSRGFYKNYRRIVKVKNGKVIKEEWEKEINEVNYTLDSTRELGTVDRTSSKIFDLLDMVVFVREDSNIHTMFELDEFNELDMIMKLKQCSTNRVYGATWTIGGLEYQAIFCQIDEPNVYGWELD